MINLFDKFKDYIPISIHLKKRKNNDFLIVMSETTDIYYLNDTASFVYECIDGNISINDIFIKMKKEYEINDADDLSVKKDIIELVRDFQWQGIIRLKEK